MKVDACQQAQQIAERLPVGSEEPERLATKSLVEAIPVLSSLYFGPRIRVFHLCR